jgi:hypothetical protein
VSRGLVVSPPAEASFVWQCGSDAFSVVPRFWVMIRYRVMPLHCAMQSVTTLGIVLRWPYVFIILSRCIMRKV